MRVCHIVSGDLWAGAEVQLSSTLKYLTKFRFAEVSVIILNQGMLEEKLKTYGIPVFVIDEKDHNFIKIFFKILGIIKEIKPDIIHSHRYKENLLSTLIGFLFSNIKTVRTQHTTFVTLDRSEKIRMKLYRLIDIITAKISSVKVIAVSEAIKNQVSLYIREDRISVIHNFVDTEEIINMANHKEFRYWNENDCFFIGTAGRLVNVKGYKYLVKAAELLCKEISNVKIIIAGSGPLYVELEDQIREARLKGKVILTGFRNDTGSIIRSLSVFVMPSLYEGIPMSLLEALALGKPVIATNVGGIPEVIKNGYNGILIEARNEKMLYEKCVFLYRNKKVRQTLAENAVKSVKEKFSPESKIDELLSVYRDIVTLS